MVFAVTTTIPTEHDEDDFLFSNGWFSEDDDDIMFPDIEEKSGGDGNGNDDDSLFDFTPLHVQDSIADHQQYASSVDLRNSACTPTLSSTMHDDDDEDKVATGTVLRATPSPPDTVRASIVLTPLWEDDSEIVNGGDTPIAAAANSHTRSPPSRNDTTECTAEALSLLPGMVVAAPCDEPESSHDPKHVEGDDSITITTTLATPARRVPVKEPRFASSVRRSPQRKKATTSATTTSLDTTPGNTTTAKTMQPPSPSHPPLPPWFGGKELRHLNHPQVNKKRKAELASFAPVHKGRRTNVTRNAIATDTDTTATAISPKQKQQRRRIKQAKYPFGIRLKETSCSDTLDPWQQHFCEFLNAPSRALDTITAQPIPKGHMEQWMCKKSRRRKTQHTEPSPATAQQAGTEDASTTTPNRYHQKHTVVMNRTTHQHSISFDNAATNKRMGIWLRNCRIQYHHRIQHDLFLPPVPELPAAPEGTRRYQRQCWEYVHSLEDHFDYMQDSFRFHLLKLHGVDLTIPAEHTVLQKVSVHPTVVPEPSRSSTKVRRSKNDRTNNTAKSPKRRKQTAVSTNTVPAVAAVHRPASTGLRPRKRGFTGSYAETE